MMSGVPLRSVAPVLCVTDMAATVDCLVNRLGFTLQGQAGDPPSWASLVRDRVELMAVCGDHPKPAQDWAAYIYVADADALFDEFTSRGADLKGPPSNKPYDNREFEVRLPDGRVLAFGGPISEK